MNSRLYDDRRADSSGDLRDQGDFFEEVLGMIDLAGSLLFFPERSTHDYHPLLEFYLIDNKQLKSFNGVKEIEGNLY